MNFEGTCGEINVALEGGEGEGIALIGGGDGGGFTICRCVNTMRGEGGGVMPLFRDEFSIEEFSLHFDEEFFFMEHIDGHVVFACSLAGLSCMCWQHRLYLSVAIVTIFSSVVFRKGSLQRYLLSFFPFRFFYLEFLASYCCSSRIQGSISTYHVFRQAVA